MATKLIRKTYHKILAAYRRRSRRNRVTSEPIAEASSSELPNEQPIVPLRNGYGLLISPPRPLPPSALSLTTIRPPTSQQAGSLLLTKLPFELRRMIWSLIFGKHTFRFVSDCNADCRPNNDPSVRYVCSIPHAFVLFLPASPAAHHIGSLLHTCRQLYAEALPILYSENTFYLPHLWAVTFLYDMLPAPQWALIRSLTLEWHFQNYFPPGESSVKHQPPHDLQTWEVACDILATMRGLRKLTVIVWKARWCARNYVDGVVRILKPLTRITGVEDFGVVVPWKENVFEAVIMEEGAPFRIMRTRGNAWYPWGTMDNLVLTVEDMTLRGMFLIECN